MVTAIELDGHGAETNIELFNQLGAQGYAPEDLRLVQRGYALALQLYTCHYRSSGRPLINHTVRTGSILAALAEPASFVAAAVAHAAYLFGDFGTRMHRISDDKRARVRAAIGDTAEAIVYRYSAVRWNESTIPSAAAGLPSFPPEKRQVVLIRLADQLDIYGTRDALYTRNLDQRYAVARTHGPAMVGMARELGYPTLAAALERAYRDCLELAPPPGLEGPRWRDGVTVPRSFRIRPSIALYRRVRTAVWRFTGR